MRTKIAVLFLAMICLGNQDLFAQPSAMASPTLAVSMPVVSQAAPSDSRSIAGDWNRELDVQGQKLGLVLHLTKNPDGKLLGTIDSLDQGANGIPVSSVDQTGDDVKLDLAGIAAGYEGRLNAARTEITGEWKQGGTLPLIFKRAGNKGAGQKTRP